MVPGRFGEKHGVEFRFGLDNFFVGVVEHFLEVVPVLDHAVFHVAVQFGVGARGVQERRVDVVFPTCVRGLANIN